MRAVGATFLLALLPLAIAVPLLGNDYQVTFVTHTALFIGLAYSWNFLCGYTGYLSFGHMAFVGIGQYTAALLVLNYGVPWVLAVPLAGVVAGATAIPLGWLILRFRGLEFAFGTLAVSQILQLLIRMSNLTGSSTGLFLPPVLSLIEVYFMAVGLVGALILATWRLENSRFGLRLIAIREDEVAARALGINTTRSKMIAFAASAIAPGAIGGLWAWSFSYVDPNIAFNVLWEVTFITMTVFGGMGVLWGPLLGGLALGFLAEYLWATFPFAHLGINGGVIVLMVLFMPAGVVPLLERVGILSPSRTLTASAARRVQPGVTAGDQRSAIRETPG